MSTKGKQLSTATRGKISLTKRKYSKEHLIEAYNSYIEQLAADPKLLPTLSGYRLAAGIGRTALDNAAANHSEVSAIIGHIEELQENYLLTRGITNQANSIFSIFLLKSKHKYLDQPQQLTQNNNINITPELLRDALSMMDK